MFYLFGFCIKMCLLDGKVIVSSYFFFVILISRQKNCNCCMIKKASLLNITSNLSKVLELNGKCVISQKKIKLKGIK